MRKRDRFAAVVQFAGVNAIDGDAGILRCEGAGIARQDKELPRREHRAIWKREGDAIKDKPGKVQCVRAGIFQFEKLELVAVRDADIGRMVHQFGERELRQILRRKENRLDERTPARAVQHTRTN